MQDDLITIQLRLPGLVVLGVKEGPTWIEVVARYERREAICPVCQRATWQVHQWQLQRKRNAKLWRKEVWIGLFKRRFRCRRCHKVFMEADPVCGPRRRTTSRLRKTVARRAREATVRSVAREEGVSEGLVERMLERHAPRETVRAVAIDLSEAYRQAIQVVLPEAAIVADKFHVLALAGRALRQVHGEKRRPGTVAWLLQRGVERLNQEERKRLIGSLSTDRTAGPSVGAEGGATLAVQETRGRRGGSGPGQLDRRRGGEWAEALPTDSEHPPQMAHRGA